MPLFDLCRPELGEGLDNEPPLPERRNLGGDNKALSALAWGAVADSTLHTPHQVLTNVIKKWGQFSLYCPGQSPPHPSFFSHLLLPFLP